MINIENFEIKKELLFICKYSFKRYSRAERDLKQARPIGEGAKKFYKAINIKPIKSPDSSELLVAMTSDQGSKFEKKIFKKLKINFAYYN